MSALKVPSLQHLARNWRADPHRIKRLLVDLVRNAPTFNYDPLFGAVRDMLVFGHPYDQIVEGMRRGIRRPDVRENLLGVLPLIRDHFDGLQPTFVQSVGRRYYPISRELMVPFDPPLIYGVSGQIHFPWFSFWRSNPLDQERLSLFVSIVEDVLLQDPDLENARFQILDFSSSKPNAPRTLDVIDAREIPRISAERRLAMLSLFAEGYSLARTELSGGSNIAPELHPEDGTAKKDQPSLFDREP